MIKVYAVFLVVGAIGLLWAILGGALAESLQRPALDLGERFGTAAKTTVGALAGFGMGGISAEFSPMDLGWPLSLILALVGAGLGVAWVRYAVSQAEG